MRLFGMALTAFALLTQPVHAAIDLTFVRKSDTTATMFASGTIDENGPFDTLQVKGVTVNTDFSFVNVSGDFAVGGNQPSSAQSLNDIIFFFDPNFQESDVATGSYDLMLESVAVFANVGASGSVHAFLVNSNEAIVGEWSIVPIPAAFPLLLTGIIGLAAVRWRKKHAAQA